jgi:hypothetical protein
MTTRSWIRKLFDRKPRTIRKDLVRFRPRLEHLEDRVTPSTTITVTSAADTANYAGTVTVSRLNPSAKPVTLIDALNAADATNGFDFALPYNSTVNALPQITATITIEGTSGYNNTIQRSTATGTPAFRLFDVAQGGALKLENLTLTGGLAQGTDSAAEGGAVYSSGMLTLSGVTVEWHVDLA